MKIIVSVTNRASYPRVKTVIGALGAHCRVYLMNPEPDILVDLENIGIGRERIRTDMSRVPGGRHSMALTSGDLTRQFSGLLEMEKPDAVVCVGDRHEVLSVAHATRIMGVKLYHLLAGERSGSIDDDIRFAITALSDVLLVPHEFAKTELAVRGYRREYVKVTGCPSIDLCRNIRKAPRHETLRYGFGSNFNAEAPFHIICIHPDVDASRTENMYQIAKGLEFACYREDVFKEASIWIQPSMHDADGAQMRKYLVQNAPSTQRIVRHMPYDLMLSLLSECISIAGNSSVMYREAAFLNKVALSVGKRQSSRIITKNIRHFWDLAEAKGVVDFSNTFQDTLWDMEDCGKAAALAILDSAECF